MFANRRAVLALLAPVIACGGGRHEGDAPSVRDSAGIIIVENRAPALGAAVALDTLLLDLGGGADLRTEFTRIAGIVLLDGGALAVADGGTQEIRRFGLDGTWQATLGRPGEGPGEFSRIARLQRLAGDSLVVYDQQLRRVSAFDPAGRLVREVTLTVEGFPRILAVLADGRMFAALRPALGPGMQLTSGLRRDTMRLALVAADGTRADSVGAAPGAEMRVDLPSGGTAGTMVRVFGVPFGRTLVTELVGGSLAWGSGDRYEITILDPSGRAVRIIRRPAPGVAPSDADLERLANAMAAGLLQADEAAREQLRQDIRETPRAATMPAHGNLLAADDGGLWVEEYRYLGDLRPPVWSVFDAEGRWQRDMTLPDRFSPRAVRDGLVAGVWRDPDDVEHVQVYRLR